MTVEGIALRTLRWIVPACAVLLAFAASTPAQAGVVEIRQAQRIVDGHSETVRLPDSVELPDGVAGPLRATYRMSFNLPQEPQRLAIRAPGLIANARVAFNGHIVSDRLGRPFDPLPRSLDRIRLIEVAQEFVRRGENVIEIEATGAGYVSISPINVGEPSALGLRYERRMLGSVVGPAFVAVVVASLALCVLLLWVRSDSLYRRLRPRHARLGHPRCLVGLARADPGDRCPLHLVDFALLVLRGHVGDLLRAPGRMALATLREGAVAHSRVRRAIAVWRQRDQLVRVRRSNTGGSAVSLRRPSARCRGALRLAPPQRR